MVNMDIIGLIKMALQALVEYLKLKNQSYYYDLLNKSRDEQTHTINEIEKLRASKLGADHDRADLLRLDLLREKELHNEYLSAKNPKP